MGKKPIPVLYIHNSSMIGGANRVVLGLLSRIGRSRFVPRSILPDHGPMEQELTKLNVPYKLINIVDNTTQGTIQQQIWQSLKLVSYTIKHNIRIIHPQSPHTFRAASILCPLLTVKSVCHLHSPCWEEADSLKWAFRISPNLMVACSCNVKDSFQNALKTIGRALPAPVIIPNFTDTEWYCPSAPIGNLRSELAVKSNTYLVSVIGRLCAMKGQKDFLHMAASTFEEIPNIHFVVAGGDSREEGNNLLELKRLSNHLGIESKVSFLGFRQNVRDIIMDSDIVVLPSSKEGMPMILLEAGACGKPVVAYDIPGVSEIVRHKITGCLVEKGNIQELVRTIKSLLNDSNLRHSLGKEARRMIEENYTLDTYVKRMESIYFRVLNGLD